MAGEKGALLDDRGDPTGDDFRTRQQADHQTSTGQGLTILVIDHRAASGRNHRIVQVARITNHALLDRPEFVLSALREDFPHRHPRPLFDPFVEIDEGDTSPLGDQSPRS